ncbi:hypothetical protein [Streptomyces sp. NPDC006552]|uniref:amino acid kinase family protein n=1 Tax=Streptomyces sp. NPDC006552 TaxID=3157179 RepID=UPI0033AFD9E4
MKKLLGFRDFGVDVLVKLGGSLMKDVDAARELGEELSRLAKTNRVIVFPGGGEIDNYIEEIDRTLHFPPEIHHQACARAQDQTGLMFSHLCPDSEVFTRPVELEPILDAGHAAIMLPMQQIIDLDVFEKTWDITSDSCAAWFAKFFDASKFAIMTNVPGIYRPGDETKTYLTSVDTAEAITMGHTSIDQCLAPYLEEADLTCTVLHGHDIESVVGWFEGGAFKGTTVYPVANSSRGSA